MTRLARSERSSGGAYDMFCGPVKLENADGAPARVLLRQT
jgi:kynurenine formamidase